MRKLRSPSRSIMFRSVAFSVVGFGLLAAGCQWAVNDADREVYGLIDRRQNEAVGITPESSIDRETVPQRVPSEAYSFVPHPVGAEVPSEFSTPTTQPSDSASTGPAEGLTEAETPEYGETDLHIAAPRTATRPAESESSRVIALAESLRYAFHNAREFQTAKEDLYLAALDLSLERHLWTPQFVSEVQSEYANYGKIRDFDQAMAAVASFGVQQRLPYGGDVTARVISTLMRDLTNHVTTGETGAVVLEANLPLLRGAGPVAYESRFQSERNLIYAVRAFERFRRAFAVEIASDYFELQRARQEIDNARASVETYDIEVARAEGLAKPGRILQLEVQRAQQDLFEAINQEIDAVEAYETGLDQFKLRIGMPTDERIDVVLPSMPGARAQESIVEQEALEEAIVMPAVTEEDAMKAALVYRLDLLNDLDRIDDAARGVNIAENNMLPDLVATGSVRYDTDPDKLGVLKYEDDRATWRAGVVLEIPLDRKEERNDLRRALIFKRRAERSYDLAQDVVRFQVRRAMRRVEQEAASVEIQEKNRDLALVRRRGARLRFDQGLVSNREIVEAERALLNARNRLVQAQARLRVAILEFRLDTGTLRVDDDGQWSPMLASAESKD